MPKRKNKNTTLDDLAGMVKHGFDSVDKRFDSVDKRFDRVEDRLDTLEQGQEEIKLKLDNVAYRFELEELQKRVRRLEMRSGIK